MLARDDPGTTQIVRADDAYAIVELCYGCFDPARMEHQIVSPKEDQGLPALTVSGVDVIRLIDCL